MAFYPQYLYSALIKYALSILIPKIILHSTRNILSLSEHFQHWIFEVNCLLSSKGLIQYIKEVLDLSILAHQLITAIVCKWIVWSDQNVTLFPWKYQCLKLYYVPITTQHWKSKICDRLWENPAYGIFCEDRVWWIFDKLYLRANPPASLRLLARFT